MFLGFRYCILFISYPASNYFIILSLFIILFILLGFRYSACSVPIICLAGVAIGAGFIFPFSAFSISRNPIISNILVRWSSTGSSSVEVSGFMGLVSPSSILYASCSYFYDLSSLRMVFYDLLFISSRWTLEFQ